MNEFVPTTAIVPRPVPPPAPRTDVLDVVEVVELPVLDVVEVVPPHVVVRVWRGVGSVCEWLFGAATLTVGLAALAAVPVLQFLTLGYLLEASGRVARGGRLRDGFPGVRKAARVGGVVLGAWLMLLPLRLVSSFATSSEIIDPDGPGGRAWRAGLFVLTVLTVGHIVLACVRGGRLRYFFWPFNFVWALRRLWRGAASYTRARDAVWDFVASLRLPYYFWLGFRGFVGGFVWLAVPVTLIAAAGGSPALAVLAALFGAPLLILVLMHLPFLQTHFAVTNRFRAMFDVRAVYAHFLRAPWLFAFAFFVLLLFALPLYLLKLEMMPREVLGVESFFFLVFIFPARLLVGWAYGLAERRAARNGPLLTGVGALFKTGFFGGTGAVVMLTAAAFFALVVYFTQFTSWHGVWSLYEQHAFLLPVPFVGM